MIWHSVLILVVLILGFSLIGRKITKMRDDIRADLDALHAKLTETETVAEGVVALIDSQNAQLRALADSGKDGDTIAAELRELADAADAVKARLGNAVAANTAATSDEKPVEEPIEETTTVDTGAAGGDGSGGGSGSEG